MLTGQETLVALQKMGFGEKMAQSVAEEFGYDKVQDLLIADPFHLMEVDGISFTRADKIARNYFSVDLNDPRRQKALVYKLLDEQRNLGHVFLPGIKLEKEMKKEGITGLEALEAALKSGALVAEENRIYTRKLWDAEVGCAQYIKERMGSLDENAWPSSAIKIDDDPDQSAAVRAAPNCKMLVITGSPGSGKTFTINKMCEALEHRGEIVGLCAPTGKAAKRMQELTGRSAKTIHRMLGASYGSWTYNKRKLLRKYTAIVVDESSMLDIDLCYRLLQSIPKGTSVILVGDVDQLPPVGPGSPFKDIILSKKVKTVRLQTNHRQGRGSVIASNARRINNGSLRLEVDDDFEVTECPTHIHLREQIPKILKGLAEAGYDLIRDVQFLSPQKSTAVGVEALNEFLRFHINKNAKRWDRFSVGDKVMQNTNDYQLGIFNGYCGQIIAETDLNYFIDFFDETTPMKYPKEKIDQLIPAYCCTVHKFQGSEIKVGICIVSSSHTYMLTRNLLYTAITRAKERCIILGDAIALKRAISNTREQERYSKLWERLVS